MTDFSKMAEEASQETDNELEKLGLGKFMTTGSAAALEAIRPKIADKETFEKLISVVNEAIENNESKAELGTRVLNGGKSLVKMANVVMSLL